MNEQELMDAFRKAREALDAADVAMYQFFKPQVEEALKTLDVEAAADLAGRCPNTSRARYDLLEKVRMARADRAKQLPNVQAALKKLSTTSRIRVADGWAPDVPYLEALLEQVDSGDVPLEELWRSVDALTDMDTKITSSALLLRRTHDRGRKPDIANKVLIALSSELKSRSITPSNRLIDILPATTGSPAKEICKHCKATYEEHEENGSCSSRQRSSLFTGTGTYDTTWRSPKE